MSKLTPEQIRAVQERGRKRLAEMLIKILDKMPQPSSGKSPDKSSPR